MVSVQHSPQNPTLAAASTGTFSDTLNQLVFPSVYTKDFDYKVERQARGFLPTRQASWPSSLHTTRNWGQLEQTVHTHPFQYTSSVLAYAQDAHSVCMVARTRTQ